MLTCGYTNSKQKKKINTAASRTVGKKTGTRMDQGAKILDEQGELNGSTGTSC